MSKQQEVVVSYQGEGGDCKTKPGGQDCYCNRRDDYNEPGGRDCYCRNTDY